MDQPLSAPEVDLEDMGTSMRQVLHLVGHEEPLLDR
jgi:hypothetical protein